jgi:hypothetical protein
MGAALALGLFALVRSRRTGGFYDAHVYAMTSRTHLWYAIASLLFAAAFCVTIVLRAEDAAIAVFALFALVAIFYLTSFLRGFSDDQE